MELGSVVDWVAVGIGTGTVIIAVLGYREAIREYRRSISVRKQDLHARLELSSIELFKLEIEHPELMKIYNEHADACSKLNNWGGKWDELSEEEGKIVEYTASVLNLFEIHHRLRLQKEIEPEIFASWIAWFYEVCNSQYFRCAWKQNLRIHYVPEFRKFIDSLLIECSKSPEAFYEKASELMGGDKVICDWPKDVQD